MSLNVFAVLAMLFVAAAEILVGTPLNHAVTSCLGSSRNRYVQLIAESGNYGLAAVFFVTALVLLVLAGHVSYFVLSLLLVALAAAGAAYYVVFPSSLQAHKVGRVYLRVMCGLIHLAGVWTVFWAVVWNEAEAYEDETLFGQEIGHFIPSTFYYSGLVLFPLFFLPPNYERGEVKHQFYEGLFYTVSGIIYFIIFRTAHYLQPGHEMSAPNWDHELLGLVWAGSGAIGIVFAQQQKQTAVHAAFPALWVCFSMITHSMSETHIDEMGLSMMEMTTWMKLHQLHGICFGVAALCRLLYRITEAVFFFFLGAIIFCFSAQWLVKYLVTFFSDPNIPEYPVDHVVALVVVTVAVVLFPLHVGALGQFRLPIDAIEPEHQQTNTASAGFAPLAMAEDMDDDDDEEHHRFATGGGGVDPDCTIKTASNSSSMESA